MVENGIYPRLVIYVFAGKCEIKLLTNTNEQQFWQHIVVQSMILVHQNVTFGYKLYFYILRMNLSDIFSSI